MLDFFPGKKTYLVAFGGALIAFGSYLTGSMELADAVQLLITSVLGATIRKGIK